MDKSDPSGDFYTQKISEAVNEANQKSLRWISECPTLKKQVRRLGRQRLEKGNGVSKYEHVLWINMMCMIHYDVFFSINIHWLLGFNENLQKQDVHNENKHSMFISQSHYHCHVSKGSAPQVGRAPQQDAPRRPLMPVRCKGLQRKVRKVGHFIQTLSPNCPFQTLFQGKKKQKKNIKATK